MTRGYLARIHPLELWLLDYLAVNPGATLADAVADSAQARQEVYRWLMKTSRRRAQDRRILDPAGDRGVSADPPVLAGTGVSICVPHPLPWQLPSAAPETAPPHSPS